MVRDKIDELAAEIRVAEPKIDDTAPFGRAVRKGCGDGPGIWFGDTAEIPLMGTSWEKRFDYRMGWLAGPGDVILIGGPDCLAFEEYQKRFTGNRRMTYLNVDPKNAVPRHAVPAICLRNADAFAKLRDAVAGSKRMTLHVHLTTGTVWALASRLAEDTGTTVYVAGPPPRLSRRCNDKLWFGEVVQRLLGSGATPPKRAAHSASALTKHVADLTRKWDRIVLKLPDSAGSAGSFLILAQEVRGMKPRSLFRHLRERLISDGRPPRFPMLIEVWDANVLTSPSVQTWIPLPKDGPPIIEGVFEQILSGEKATFIGARQAELPKRIDERLCKGALQLATLFQRLGFFGRCSFDALVTGVNSHVSEIHWIECNARWGGVSIPMSLVSRMAAASTSPKFVIVQRDNDSFLPIPFAKALLKFADLTPPPDLKAGILFLSPNLMEAGAGCHFLSFGANSEAAEAQSQEVVRRLLGAD